MFVDSVAINERRVVPFNGRLLNEFDEIAWRLSFDKKLCQRDALTIIGSPAIQGRVIFHRQEKRRIERCLPRDRVA